MFSNDKLFSDSYKVNLVDGVLYEVVGKYETCKEGKVVLAGANTPEGDADKGTL